MTTFPNEQKEKKRKIIILLIIIAPLVTDVAVIFRTTILPINRALEL